MLYKEHNGEKYYRSQQLEDIWDKGHSIIGELSFESAAYVARYITKKFMGPGSERFYEVIDENTGEVYSLKPEYVTMSRRPGIGKIWFDKFKADVFPDDFIVVDRKGAKVKMRPPKYFDSLYDLADAEGFASVKARRQVDAVLLNFPVITFGAYLYSA